jgi:universal protein Kae1
MIADIHRVLLYVPPTKFVVDDGWVLGIESTAHTFSFGLVDGEGKPYPSESSTISPAEGGIHPRKAAEHHAETAGELLARLLQREGLGKSNLSAIAFSQGPGLAPCLRAGASAARTLSTALAIPMIGVNHCVAHIEIGREQCGCDDPVLLYASGGNTQVITRLAGKYRVLGETLDIGIGNMLDKFARSNGIPFPGGPKVEQHALLWNEDSLDELSLPYVVQGMDLAFSGILTAATKATRNGTSFDAVCWSLQEHAFAACVEVAERALAHSGKTELLLGGGVACNERLREMCEIMCAERGAKSYAPPKMYCVDNGTMIARLGWLELGGGRVTSLVDSAIIPTLRTDDSEIIWA